MAPTPTIHDLLASTEASKQAAERRAGRAKNDLRNLKKSLDQAGIPERMWTDDQVRRMTNLYDEHTTAIGEIKEADRQLAQLREVEAEEAEADRKARTPDPAYRDPVTGIRERETERWLDGRGTVTETADANPWRRSNDGGAAVVERGQRFADHDVVKAYAERRRDSDQMVTGTHGNFAHWVRSLSTSGASAIVPTVWSNSIIDKARNASVAFQAGCQLVPMDAKVVQIGRLTTDPTAAFRTEGSSITASDPGFDFIQLTATTLSALTVASVEFLQDAVNAESVVTEALAKVMALDLDKAVLFGQLGATGTNDEGAAYGLASPYPKGVLKNLLDNASGQVLGFATNGTAQTAATPWNEVISTIYQVKTQNEVPRVMISNDKLVQQYASMYDTTNQPLNRPAVVNDYPWLVTNVIPSFTRGTMTSRATDLFVGDFSQVLVGQRMELEIRLLTERYAELGQVGILAYWRGDVQVARPKALAVYRALQGAA